MSLSSGAFGLSLLFIDKLGGEYHYARRALVMAWVCFLIAMLSNLISYHTSAAAARSEVAKVDECLRTASEYSVPANRYRTFTHILNLAALLLFTVGASALAYFAFANI